MDVSWYVAETIVRDRLADLRVAAERHRSPVAAAAPRRSRRRLPAALRLGHRLLAGLGATAVVGWRRSG